MTKKKVNKASPFVRHHISLMLDKVCHAGTPTEGFAMYDDGWDDQRIVDVVRGQIGGDENSVTVSQVRYARDTIFGKLYQPDNKAMRDVAVAELSERVKRLETICAGLLNKGKTK